MRPCVVSRHGLDCARRRTGYEPALNREHRRLMTIHTR